MQNVGILQVIDIALDQTPEPRTNWRFRMEAILEELESHATGLLIAVDEVDVGLPEMMQLATVYQHFVREEHRVALFMAGLPHAVSALVSNKTVSFLRRAQKVGLGRIPDYEIRSAFEKTVRENGRDINDDALDQAILAIQGFPFLMQFVGFRAWDQNPTRVNISLEDMERGIARAREEMRDRILDATYRELSHGDRRFLGAMLPDAGDSGIADIEEHTRWSSSLTAQYRRRLIDAGVIGGRSRGVVGFDLPFFREYLLDEMG